MAFSVEDDRWPYLAVLVWIATRSDEITRREAGRSYLKWADENLAMLRSGVGGIFPPRGPSIFEAKDLLADALDRGLRGVATRVEVSAKARDASSSIARFHPWESVRETPIEGVLFPPEDSRSVFRTLIDSGSEGRAPTLIGEATDDDTTSFRTQINWRELTFAREDVLRLWPEHPQSIAYRRSLEQPWATLPPFDQGAIAALKAPRAPLESVLDGMTHAQAHAQGSVEALAERMRAVNWLFDRACVGDIEIFGTSRETGERGCINPEQFDNGALALAPSRTNAIGGANVLAHFSKLGGSPDGAKWCDVTVDLGKLRSLVTLRATVPLTMNERKRNAVLKAFKDIGYQQLETMSQKNREPVVIQKVKELGESVSDRYVRKRWAEMSICVLCQGRVGVH